MAFFVCQDCTFLFFVELSYQFHVCWRDKIKSQRIPNRRMLDTVERCREINGADVQRYTPHTTTLLQDPVHRQVVLASVVRPETGLVKGLYSVQIGSESCIQDCRK